MLILLWHSEDEEEEVDRLGLDREEPEVGVSNDQAVPVDPGQQPHAVVLRHVKVAVFRGQIDRPLGKFSSLFKEAR